jgi:DNA replication and repair protein RecF
VVFCPQHLTLVSGSPSLRRKFVDGALCQIYPNYIKVFKTFEKYLEQKNSLLKNQNRYYFEEFNQTLDIYNRHLAALGYEIYLKRKEYIDLMSQKAKDYYSKISSGRENIDFKYLSFGENPEDFNSIAEYIDYIETKCNADDAIVAALKAPDENNLMTAIYRIDIKYGYSGRHYIPQGPKA